MHRLGQNLGTASRGHPMTFATMLPGRLLQGFWAAILRAGLPMFVVSTRACAAENLLSRQTPERLLTITRR